MIRLSIDKPRSSTQWLTGTTVYPEGISYSNSTEELQPWVMMNGDYMTELMLYITITLHFQFDNQ